MDQPPVVPAPRRRRIWPWVLGICLAPFVILGIAVASVVTLSRDASILRRHVMAATDADWHTKVQMSVPGVLLGVVRSGMCLVHNSRQASELEDAKLALRAVKRVSVGVYELDQGDHTNWSREQLFAETDKAMQKRGWVRMVGVIDDKDTVLIYTPQDMDPGEPVDICLAGVSGNELVVCSTSVDFDELAKLAERHMKDGLKGHLRLARFH